MTAAMAITATVAIFTTTITTAVAANKTGAIAVHCTL